MVVGVSDILLSLGAKAWMMANLGNGIATEYALLYEVRN